MGKWKVLVSSSDLIEAGVSVLKEKCEVLTVPLIHATKEAVLEMVSGVDALLWCSSLKLDADIINAAGPQLKVVATASAGYDHIDARLLKEKGILFGNTPRVLDDAVADVGVALVLDVSRRLQEGRRAIERGTWESGRTQFMLGHDVAGSTVGIVGLGGIGQAFAKRIKVFNIGKLQYSGRYPKPEAAALGAEFVSFSKLVETSDIILIACPLTPETNKLFNAAVFKKMKSNSILVNVGRGPLIDQDALVEALKTNQIWGAGLDVMYPEPLPTDHPLLSLDNCVLYPHVGSATVETRSAMAALAAKNILSGLEGKPLPAPV